MFAVIKSGTKWDSNVLYLYVWISKYAISYFSHLLSACSLSLSVYLLFYFCISNTYYVRYYRALSAAQVATPVSQSHSRMTVKLFHFCFVFTFKCNACVCATKVRCRILAHWILPFHFLLFSFPHLFRFWLTSARPNFKRNGEEIARTQHRRVAFSSPIEPVGNVRPNDV